MTQGNRRPEQWPLLRHAWHLHLNQTPCYHSYLQYLPRWVHVELILRVIARWHRVGGMLSSIVIWCNGLVCVITARRHVTQVKPRSVDRKCCSAVLNHIDLFHLDHFTEFFGLLPVFLRRSMRLLKKQISMAVDNSWKCQTPTIIASAKCQTIRIIITSNCTDSAALCVL